MKRKQPLALSQTCNAVFQPPPPAPLGFARCGEGGYRCPKCLRIARKLER